MSNKMLKISDELSKSAERYLAPIKDLPIAEQVRTPNYSIAVAVKEVSDIIRREFTDES